MRALVSVANVAESALALQLGFTLIDLKAPQNGALGELDLNEIKAICHYANGQAELSATIGDIALSDTDLVSKVIATHECGVSLIKVGMFQPLQTKYLEQLQALSSTIKMVAVLFAEDSYPHDFILTLKQMGFIGVMLDTRIKQEGNLTDYMTLAQLKSWVAHAHTHQFMVGLSGSLSLDMWQLLIPTGADYLGFRGAVCDNGRASSLCPDKLGQLKRMVDVMPQVAIRSTLQRTK